MNRFVEGAACDSPHTRTVVYTPLFNHHHPEQIQNKAVVSVE